MNIREITPNEVKFSLETLRKIFNEKSDQPVYGLIEGFSPDMAAQDLTRKGFRFFSAFENGAEIGCIVLKDNHICSFGVKGYARGRGVGTELLDYVIRTLKPKHLTVNAELDVVPFYASLGFEESGLGGKEDLGYKSMKKNVKKR